jgi:hypothetical protein
MLQIQRLPLMIPRLVHIMHEALGSRRRLERDAKR